MITFAFYKGRGRFLDRLIRLVTGGKYSHCEVLLTPLDRANCALAFSASMRDGGVREKHIQFKDGHWDFITLHRPVDLNPVLACRGAQYDWIGAVLSVLPWRIWQHPSKWFCSEICAVIVGLPITNPSGFARELRKWSAA
jgi:hypothetical protein